MKIPPRERNSDRWSFCLLDFLSLTDVEYSCNCLHEKNNIEINVSIGRRKEKKPMENGRKKQKKKYITQYIRSEKYSLFSVAISVYRELVYRIFGRVQKHSPILRYFVGSFVRSFVTAHQLYQRNSVLTFLCVY